MLPFINKLIELYKQKRRILKDLKEFIEPISEILNDPAFAYTDEDIQMLQTHVPFHKGTGLISLLNELVKANVELRHYEEEDKTSIKDEHGINMEMNLASLGEDISSSYREMMELVDQEHRILINFLKPAIGEILQRQDWHEWIGHLRHFPNFVVVLEEDIKMFKNLLKILLERGHLEELREERRQAADHGLVVGDVDRRETTPLATTNFPPDLIAQEREFIQLWEGCTSFEIFKSRFEPLHFSVAMYSGISLLNKKIEDPDLWIASKRQFGYAFPCYNLKPYAALILGWYEGYRRKPIRNIRKLVKIIFRDGEWQLLEKGEIGEATSPRKESYQAQPQITLQEQKLLAVANKWLEGIRQDPNLVSRRIFLELCQPLGLEVEFCILKDFGKHIGTFGDMPFEFEPSNHPIFVKASIEGTNNEYFMIALDHYSFVGEAVVVLKQFFDGWERSSSNPKFEKIYRAARFRNVGGNNYELISKGYMTLKGETPTPPVPPEPISYESFVTTQNMPSPEITVQPPSTAKYIADVSIRGRIDVKPYERLLEEVKAFISAHPNVVTWLDLARVNEVLCLKFKKGYELLMGVEFDLMYGPGEREPNLSYSIEKMQEKIYDEKTLFGSIKKGNIDATYFTDPKTGEWKELWGSLNIASAEDTAILDEALERKRKEFPQSFNRVLEGDSPLRRRLEKKVIQPSPPAFPLPTNARAEIEEIKSKLEAYSRIIRELLNETTNTEAIRNIRSRQGRIEKYLDTAKGLLEGRIYIEERRKVLNLSNESFLDFTYILIDEIFGEIGGTYDYKSRDYFKDRQHLKELVEELLRLGRVKIILPRPGERVNHEFHVHEAPRYVPGGRELPYPEVAYVLMPGYIYGGSVFRSARVEVRMYS